MPLVFMIVMCLFVGFMARRAGGWRCGVGRIGPGPYSWRGPGPMAQGWPETPSQILDRRYAGGEITREQYEQMKRDLELVDSRPGSGAG
jgi:putative membrane protein